MGNRWKRNDGSDISVVYWRDPPEAVYLRLHDVGDEAMITQLAFRDYLRDNEAARREYEEVIRDAAAKHDEFQPYQEAKKPAVRDLTEQAREKGYIDTLPDRIFE